ncbi:hypothetical protein GCM10023151_00630 [Kangiella marina]|uniref:Uncharacterized protein n=1 Tax=Kangiella marina TaxID=1079178 RepID=A0ABP8IA86_9GAMM
MLYKLKDNGYIKLAKHVTCHSVPLTTVYNDDLDLKAVHLLKRCDDSDTIKNTVLIENKETGSEVVYQSELDFSERIYLVWEQHDGLVIAKPELSDDLTSKKYRTIYSVTYLPLKEFRVALGHALTDYKHSSLNNVNSQ